MITGDVLAGVHAVIVDWDGTVVDSHQANLSTLNQALHPCGVQIDPAWYHDRSGLSIRDLLAEITAVHGDLPTAEIIAASRQRLLANLDQLRPVPATIDLLTRARDRGLPCAVASCAVRVVVHTGIHTLRLHHLFAAIVTREDVRRGKPAPDLYLRAAALLDVPAGNCLAIDDAADGIAAARAAGMLVLTVHHQTLCWADTQPDHARTGREAPA